MHFATVFLALAALATLSITNADDMTASCNNFYMQGTSLVGTCNLKNGSTTQASVDLTECVRVITNAQLELELQCTNKYAIRGLFYHALIDTFERRGDNTLDNCACVPWDEYPGNLSFQCKCLFPPQEDQYTNTINLGMLSFAVPDRSVLITL